MAERMEVYIGGGQSVSKDSLDICQLGLADLRVGETEITLGESDEVRVQRARSSEAEKVVLLCLERALSRIMPSSEYRIMSNICFTSNVGKQQLGELDHVLITRKKGIFDFEVMAGSPQGNQQMKKGERYLCAKLEDVVRTHDQQQQPATEKLFSQAKRTKRSPPRPTVVACYPNFARHKGGRDEDRKFFTFWKEDFYDVDVFQKRLEILLQKTDDFDSDLYEETLTTIFDERLRLDAVSKHLICLTDEQSKQLRDKQHRKLLLEGAAGTGKTTMLTLKLQEEIKSDTSKRRLYLCYNKNLAAQQRRVLKLNPSEEYPKHCGPVTVCTFNMLMEWEKHETVGPIFDDIFIDEGQDIVRVKHMNSAIMKCWKQSPEGLLWMAKDPSQFLGFQDHGQLHIRFEKTVKLQSILRNTAPISNRVLRILKPTDRKLFPSTVHGPPPSLFHVDVAQELHPTSLNWLYEKLSQALHTFKLKPFEIIILVCSKDVAKELREILHPHFLDVEFVDGFSFEERVFQKNHHFCLTVDSIDRSKGLERKAVILFDDHPLSNASDETFKRQRALYYVACSRPAVHLWALFHKSKSPAADAKPKATQTQQTLLQ